jgi:hypothetical protein
MKSRNSGGIKHNKTNSIRRAAGTKFKGRYGIKF